MESIKNIIKAQPSSSLPRLLSESLVRSDSEGCYISKYQDQLTTPCIIDNIAKIKKSFPNLPVEFYDVLSNRIKDNGFTDQRFTDAVNHVIDTCIYPNPTIANFTSFDRKVRLLTYDHMLEQVNKFGNVVWSYYKIKEVNNIKYWYNENENR